MFDFNRRKKEVTIKLEGCLKESTFELCKHNEHADTCWFCQTGREPSTESDSNDSNDSNEEDLFESKMFKSKLGT